MDQDDIALRPFVSKMLCYYETVLRETFAEKSKDRQVNNVYFFVRTDTGQHLSTSDVTKAVQRSCQRFVDPDRRVTSIGMRHAYATHWFGLFKAGKTPGHLQTVDQFLDWLAAKMNTGKDTLRKFYISNRLVAPVVGTRLVEYPPELDTA